MGPIFGMLVVWAQKVLFFFRIARGLGSDHLSGDWSQKMSIFLSGQVPIAAIPIKDISIFLPLLTIPWGIPELMTLPTFLCLLLPFTCIILPSTPSIAADDDGQSYTRFPILLEPIEIRTNIHTNLHCANYILGCFAFPPKTWISFEYIWKEWMMIFYEAWSVFNLFQK